VSRIFWDTNLFIYVLEARGDLARKTKRLRQRMTERGDLLVTSAITLGEVLVKPKRLGRLDLVKTYEQALRPPAVSIIAFDEHCARIYAEVRQDKAIQAADAVQLSCSAHARCDMFVTNDERLSRKMITGIHFIASLDRALLFIGAGQI
jgi:predicted nucleic acid-binding protein